MRMLFMFLKLGFKKSMDTLKDQEVPYVKRIEKHDKYLKI
jgi:hypothetical protein